MKLLKTVENLSDLPTKYPEDALNDSARSNHHAVWSTPTGSKISLFWYIFGKIFTGSVQIWTPWNLKSLCSPWIAISDWAVASAIISFGTEERTPKESRCVSVAGMQHQSYNIQLRTKKGNGTKIWHGLYFHDEICFIYLKEWKLPRNLEFFPRL